MQRPLPAIFVQTKSHKVEGLRVTMKLSNALKLARSPSPCFALLLTKGSDGCDAWYGVHFWDELMARVLKRAREATRNGTPEGRFNKLSFSFTMSEADRHDADGLLDWMADQVRSAGPHYATAKQELHGGPDIVGTLSIGPSVSIEQLIDHQLGLTPSIPLASIRLSLRRFGIDLPFPFPVPEGPANFASMQALPSAVCDIRLRGPDGIWIDLAGEVIAPGLPNIPEDKQKIRIRAPFFDIIWPLSGEPQFKAHFDTAARHSPIDLERMLRFLSWTGQGEIDLRVSIGDRPILGAISHLDALEGQPMYAALAEHATALATLSAHHKTNVPRISMEDVMDSEEADQLLAFLSMSDLGMKVEPAGDGQWHDIDHAIASGAGLYGEWTFAAIQRLPVTSQKREGAEVHIRFGKPVLLERYAFPQDDEAALERLQADFRRHIAKRGILGLEYLSSQLVMP
ncbi:hypothetical protein [Sphingopyxis panaciterrulae]|uniref:Uncharacterized protein n=2 Tax=Sphingopyxis TaxID=165697 RepID=A0A7W9B8I7_9SPHN|nr:hypothetical protein [Sphingopyxis panaciterrulae]MBB5708168.1 hypothetical protein [Sphingopyxis panaciterrulae]